MRSGFVLAGIFAALGVFVFFLVARMRQSGFTDGWTDYLYLSEDVK